jgi:hypothetical protein
VFGQGLFPFAEGYLVLARVIVLVQVLVLGLEANTRITSHSDSKNNLAIKTAPHSVWSRVISIFIICEGLFGLGEGYCFGASIGKDFYKSQVTAILKITQQPKSNHTVFGQGLFPFLLFAKDYLVLARVIALKQG